MANLSWAAIQPEFWDLLALMVAMGGLALGLRLAFWGRVKNAEWASFIEAVSMMAITSLLTNLVLIATRNPPNPTLAAIIGLVGAIAGFLIAGKDQKRFYGLAGLATSGATMLFVVVPMPGFPILGLGGLLVLLAAVIGFFVGELVFKVRIVIGTAAAGAQWIGTSLIGLIQIPRRRSEDFLGDRLLDYFAPLLNGLYDLWTKCGFDFFLVFLGIVLPWPIFFVAARYQWRHVDDPPRKWPEELRALLREPWRLFKKSIGRWAIAGCAFVLAYLAVATYWRAMPPPSGTNDKRAEVTETPCRPTIAALPGK